MYIQVPQATPNEALPSKYDGVNLTHPAVPSLFH
jgi:hypothetical protein